MLPKTPWFAALTPLTQPLPPGERRFLERPLEACVAERPEPSGVEGLSSMGYQPWGCSALCCLGLGMVTLQCMFSSALPPTDRRSLPVVSGAASGVAGLGLGRLLEGQVA
jgi:hypothetical protein